MTSTMSFDLLKEPWIVCETLEGKREVLGIAKVLARAHELAAVCDESPLVTAATYRMLLAIVDQAYQPKNRAEWLALWNAKKLPEGPLGAYFEKWAGRFDLFDTKRPFLQVARLDEILRETKGKDAERISAWRFVMEMSTYSSEVHLLEPEPPHGEGLTPQEAARALMSFQAFAAGGRVTNESQSWGGGAVRNGAVVLLQGRTLRETLTLNTIARATRGKDDVPPWQRERNIERVKRSASGSTDLLVWPARCVKLFGNRDSGAMRVTAVLSAAGEWAEGEVADPQMAYYVRDPKEPPMALRFHPDRALWRDSSALFDAATGVGAFRRPLAVDQVQALVRDRMLPSNASLRIHLSGLYAKPVAAIRFVRFESLPLPTAVLTDKARLAVLKDGLTLTDRVGVRIDAEVLFDLCAWALAPGARSPDPKDVRQLKGGLAVMPGFWSALGEAFQRWLVEVGAENDPDDALASWRKTVRKVALSTFDAACRRLGLGARSLQAVAQARTTLHRVLAELLPEPASAESLNATQAGEASP